MTPQDYKYHLEDNFLMPLDIINEIENLYDSRKNESKIMTLINKNGIDTCSNGEHQDIFESLDQKHMGNDDEFETQEYCLGCGGIIEN